MSLSLAFDNAKSALAATSTQTAVVSRNIGNAGQGGYTRKAANTVTTDNGGVRIGSIDRAFDTPLFLEMLTNTSSAAENDAVVASLDQLESTVGDTNAATSLSAKLAALKTALSQAATQPDDKALASAAVVAAGTMADALNRTGDRIQATRADADRQMSDIVTSVNDLLKQLQTVNDAIVKGTALKSDVTDALDTRDQLLSRLSENIGIRVVQSGGNGVSVYTDSGVTLFDRTPRNVAFTPTAAFAATTTGNAVYVDGVAVTGAQAVMPISSGKLAGLATVRDTTAPTYQNQVDELARGLVEAFAETDQSGGGLPAVAGLFTWSGAPAVPATGTLSAGISASIRVAARVDPDQGGDVGLLRDGNVSGAGSAYVCNAAGAAGFSARLESLVDGIGANRSFSATGTALPATADLSEFAATSMGWFEGLRKTAAEDQTYSATMLSKTSEALSNDTGVNIDDELAKMLDLERSYGAASKLLNAVDGMMRTLLAAVGAS
jgi:flagellar hook-associated protein 1 FlgK